jgi:hypothetical protein
MRISILALSAFLFGACNHSSSPDDPPAYHQDISAYLPLHIGNIWNYRYDSGTEKAIIQKRVLDTLRHTDGSLLYAYNEDVQVNNPPQNPSFSGYNIYNDGTIYSYNSSNDSLLGGISASKAPLLKEPLQVGNSWIYSDYQHVDTSAIAFVWPSSFNDTVTDTVVLVVRRSDVVVDSSWYGRGVGLLKRRLHSFSGDSGVMWDLENYTLAN